MSAKEAAAAIVDSQRLAANDVYRMIWQDDCSRFDADSAFRQACLAASSWVLQSRSGDCDFSDNAAHCAVRYLLAELPLFRSASEVLGCASAVFCYHQCPEFIANLYAEKHGPLVSNNQGFVVVDAHEATVTQFAHAAAG